MRCSSAKGRGTSDVCLKMGVVHIHRQIWEGYTCGANGHVKYGTPLFMFLTPSLIARSTAEYNAIISGMPEFQDPILEFSGSRPESSRIQCWKKFIK